MPDNKKRQPLAARMRPQKIEDIVGQEHLLAPDAMLYKMIKADKLRSVILYGPPGTGKTTIANIIANETSAVFETVNAVAAGKKDLEKVCTAASESDRKTVLFIDEIHRFNKTQQDYLLPYVERGDVILIGATTENPYFEVNPALVSRSTVFMLRPVSSSDIENLILRALNDKENGLGDEGITIQKEALEILAEQSNGDVRFALSNIEIAAVCVDPADNTITPKIIKDIIQKPHLTYDKDGDMHYDTISAFIKSMRGSDPDACLYWLARMIETGEDPKFIARRMMICASEDVGNADPMALVIATSAALAAERVGFPEASIILAQAVIYIANAPKSNSACVGISRAQEYIRKHPTNDVPNHLRDAHYKSAAKLGHGTDYIYPHDYPEHFMFQQYLPNGVPEGLFYQNSGVGYEASQKRYRDAVARNLQRRIDAYNKSQECCGPHDNSVKPTREAFDKAAENEASYKARIAEQDAKAKAEREKLTEEDILGPKENRDKPF